MSKQQEPPIPPANKGKHPPRSIRVPDNEWSEWAALARDRGESITAMIRAAINRMVKGAKKR